MPFVVIDPETKERTTIEFPNEATAKERGIVHPARYSPPLYPVLAGTLQRAFGDEDLIVILDPFAGIGGIHNLVYYLPNVQTVGVEIEREWATCHPDTIVGNSHKLNKMFAPEIFDAIVTSPVYGNRMSDDFTPRDSSTRISYKITLGRKLSRGTTANMQYGDKYRQSHVHIWRQSWNVLRPGGLFILNIKDHIRNGRVVPVTQFHIDALVGMGFKMTGHEYVPLAGYKFGQNFKSRMTYESVLTFRKPEDAQPLPELEEPAETATD